MAPYHESPIMNGEKTTNGHANGIPKSRPGDETPDLATRLYVNRSEKAFASGAVSLVDLPAHALFARITTATPATKAYTSVQTGEDSHIELNSELVFCNHSCDPSVIFDMAKFEVRVGDRELKKGDALTFWYPSSEWDMAQPFDCSCGSVRCKGTITGAKDMDEGVLREYWLNEHIERMLAAKK
jgi:hypothetical protein